jgi:hypothetical protein
LQTAVLPPLQVTAHPEQLSTEPTRHELTPFSAPGGGPEFPSNSHWHFA